MSLQIPLYLEIVNLLYFAQNLNPISIASNIQKAIENHVKLKINEISIKKSRNEEFKFQVDKLIQIIKSA